MTRWIGSSMFTQICRVVIPLLRKVAVVLICRAVAQKHCPLDITLDGTLVGCKREEEFVETLHMLPCLHRTVLLQVLRESQHQRLALVKDIYLLSLRLGKAVCLPKREAHKRSTDKEVGNAEEAYLPEAGLDVFK